MTMPPPTLTGLWSPLAAILKQKRRHEVAPHQHSLLKAILDEPREKTRFRISSKDRIWKRCSRKLRAVCWLVKLGWPSLMLRPAPLREIPIPGVERKMM